MSNAKISLCPYFLESVLYSSSFNYFKLYLSLSTFSFSFTTAVHRKNDQSLGNYVLVRYQALIKMKLSLLAL